MITQSNTKLTDKIAVLYVGKTNNNKELLEREEGLQTFYANPESPEQLDALVKQHRSEGYNVVVVSDEVVSANKNRDYKIGRFGMNFDGDRSDFCMPNNIEMDVLYNVAKRKQ